MSLFGGITSFPAFCVAVFLFLALPGPGTLALLSSTSQGGLRAGMAATLGVIAGDQILLWLAAAGLATLLTSHPLAFAVLQGGGAAYLIWLGIGLVRAPQASSATAPGSPPATAQHARRAFLITVLNPKAVLFYLAFFPQFVRPQDSQPLMTLAVMATTIAMLTAMYGLTLCAMASKAAQLIASDGPWIRRLLGLSLMGFGLHLLWRSVFSS